MMIRPRGKKGKEKGGKKVVLTRGCVCVLLDRVEFDGTDYEFARFSVYGFGGVVG